MKKLKIKLQREHHFVVGSRRVVKSVDLTAEEGKNSWYADGDLWTRHADALGLSTTLPKDHIVYGELVGFTGPGSQIQKGYTYGELDGNAKLYVYRVAMVSTDGRVVDYTHGQLELFCAEHGLTPVPVLWEGLHRDFDASHWLDRRYHERWSRLQQEFVQPPIPLSDKGTVDEGVCIRYDGPMGAFFTKAKSPIFLAHETKLLDAEALDLEAVA